jgi:hypothetical protein
MRNQPSQCYGVSVWASSLPAEFSLLLFTQSKAFRASTRDDVNIRKGGMYICLVKKVIRYLKYKRSVLYETVLSPSVLLK